MSLPLTRRLTVDFPALQHRDFRLIWIGQLLSFSGSRMQTAAILWHVSLLAAPGRKAIALGLVGAAQVVPIVVFAMLSGVVADALECEMFGYLATTPSRTQTLSRVKLTTIKSGAPK